MSKDEKPAIWCIRRGDSLIPEMMVDAENMRRIAPGVRVKVKVAEGRTQDRLRLYWAFLGRVVKATGCAPTSEDLHGAVKLGVGLVTPVMLKGWQVNIPRSVAFDKMAEGEFMEFLQSAEAWVIENYGISIADAFSEERAGELGAAPFKKQNKFDAGSSLPSSPVSTAGGVSSPPPATYRTAKGR